MKNKKLRRMKRGRTFVKGLKRENEQKIVKKGKKEDLHNRNSRRRTGERKKMREKWRRKFPPSGWDAAGPFIGPISLSLISCSIGMCSLS